MSHLLTAKWENLNGNERSEALRLATSAGIGEAAADAAAAGGVEAQTPSAALYYRRLVEFADEAEVGLDDLDGDPRSLRPRLDRGAGGADRAVTTRSPASGAAAALGRLGGSANTAAQFAQRRAAAVRGGRPRLALPCIRCGAPTTERDRSRRPDCGAH